MTAATGRAGPPPTSAQTYQRLRSHLAFLKMAAAAETLPAVLDAAREDGTPPLEAIEALLAVQVNATEHRQQASRLHFANLPAPWSIDLSGVDLDLLTVSAGSEVSDASAT